MKLSKTLDEKALLEKNPKAAKVLKRNRKKIEGRVRRRPKEYGLGLPYARPSLVFATDSEDDSFQYELRA